MTEQYNKQDGGPPAAAAQPDSNETASDPKGAQRAVVGERSTEEGVAGQGLGQITDEKDERKITEKQ